MAKLAADAITVMEAGTYNLLCQTTEVEIEVEATDEDGACINEADDYPLAVSRARTINMSGNINTAAVAIKLMEATSLNVTFNLVLGSVTMTGNGLMSFGSARAARKSLQSQRLRIKVQGKPTVTIPTIPA